jgi:hypothetical protein
MPPHRLWRQHEIPHLSYSTVDWAASSAVTAHDRECTNSTIKGDYAFTIHGQILTPGGPLLVDGIAKTTFDGDGKLTQVAAVAINGNIPLLWSPSTGTYTVNSDCTGTMTLISTGQPTLHLAILVSQSGNHIHTVVTDLDSRPLATPSASGLMRIWISSLGTRTLSRARHVSPAFCSSLGCLAA